MKIEKNAFVKLHFELKDDKGTVIDSSIGDDPLEYIHGLGFFIEGLEEALEGKEIGEKLNISLSPEKAYGEVSEDLISEVPVSEFGDELSKLEVGQPVQITSDDGEFVVTVSEIKDDVVVLDANHPLAGKTLVFDIEILEVRVATEDEIQDFINADECGCGDDCDCDDDSEEGCGCGCGCH